MSKSDTIRQIDLTDLTPVLEFDFEPDEFTCGNCNRTIRQDESFRTIAPSKIRYHVGCVSSKIVGSNAAENAAGQRSGIGGGYVEIDDSARRKFKPWP